MNEGREFIIIIRIVVMSERWSCEGTWWQSTSILPLHAPPSVYSWDAVGTSFKSKSFVCSSLGSNPQPTELETGRTTTTLYFVVTIDAYAPPHLNFPAVGKNVPAVHYCKLPRRHKEIIANARERVVLDYYTQMP